MSRRGDETACKVYVGDLPRDCSEKELERSFSYYGPLKKVWVAKNPPGFAFVEFEDDRDAEDAVRGLDGTTICGNRARVEHSNGRVRSKPWAGGGRGDRGGGMGRGGGGGRMDDRGRGGGGPRGRFDPNDRCYQCGERGHYAYDCRNSRGGGGGSDRGGSRRRSRSRSRSYEKRRRSRTRSRSRDSRSRSRSRS